MKKIIVRLTLRQAEYIRNDCDGLSGSCDTSWQSRLYQQVAAKIDAAIRSEGRAR